MHRIVLLVLAAALCSASSAAAAKAPLWVGVWKGTVKTAAGDATTPVVVTVNAKYKSNKSGTIAYAQQKCTGKLAFLQQSGRVLTLRETGPARCSKGGTVQITWWAFQQLWIAWYATGSSTPTWSGYVTPGGR